MICTSSEKDMTSEEINSIGKDFASRFYDAFVGKPDASALIRFFDQISKYSFVQRCNGRPDFKVQGADLIAKFAERMQYGRCTAVTIRSVNTTRVGSTRFKVSVVGELLCPANDVARKFLQTTVIKRVAWTRAEFLVLDTVFEFDDRIVDDVLPRTSSTNARLFDPLKPVVQVAAHNIDAAPKSVKPATVKGRPRPDSIPLRIPGNPKRRYVRTMDVFNSNAEKNPKHVLQNDESKTVGTPMTTPQELKPKVFNGQLTDNPCKGDGDKNISPSSTDELVAASQEQKKSSPKAVRDTRTTCVRKAKNAATDPMADFVPSYIGGSSKVSNTIVKQKADIVRPTAALGDSRRKSGPCTDDNCNRLAITAVVSNKKTLAAKSQSITVKPIASPKVESKETPSAGEKVGKKPKSEQPKERPTRNVKNAKIFVPSNRFGCLMVDDVDFDSHSSNEDNSMSPSENTPKVLTRNEKNRKRNNRLRNSTLTSTGPEEVNTAGVPGKKEISTTSVNSSPKDSGERANICNQLLNSPRTFTGPEEAIAARVPTDRKMSTRSVYSSSRDSDKRSKILVTCDPSPPGRLETLAALPDELIVAPPPAPMAAADDDLALESAKKDPSGRLKNKRRNRKINNKKLRDGAATAIVNEAEGPSISEKCPPSVTSHSYIRRFGSIYGRAFITEVIYPLFYNIIPLDWC